jgi:NTE family protein
VTRRGCRRALGLLALLGLAGCAAPLNPKLARYDGVTGYRYDNLGGEAGGEELFVILAFSGGGTRAAAFSFGVLEGLRDVVYQGPAGPKRRLLDEVDVISSVSGGSFTAAYYALFRDDAFDRFGRAFLYRNIQRKLLMQALLPWNWARLARPDFSRIDLAAELYDREVFEGATFDALVMRGRRPYVLLNATDMTLGARFEFTQDQFDLLCSNLSPVTVGRAVAASSAFPILLSPLTLRNYAAEGCEYRTPVWLANALRPENPPRRAALAHDVFSYQANKSERPYVHLLDGGLSDNIGLRGPYIALSGQDSGWSVYSRINAGKIRRVLVITANAKTGREPAWDERRSPPGIIDVLGLVTTGPMGNYSFETVQLIADHFKALARDVQNVRDCQAVLNRQCPGTNLEVAPVVADFHAVELSFDEVVGDNKLRRWL